MAGITPLQVAIIEGHYGAVEQLLNCGANVNGPAANGALPLAFTVGRDNKEITELLRRNGGILK